MKKQYTYIYNLYYITYIYNIYITLYIYCIYIIYIWSLLTFLDINWYYIKQVSDIHHIFTLSQKYIYIYIALYYIYIYTHLNCPFLTRIAPFSRLRRQRSRACNCCNCARFLAGGVSSSTCAGSSRCCWSLLVVWGVVWEESQAPNIKAPHKWSHFMVPMMWKIPMEIPGKNLVFF